MLLAGRSESPAGAFPKVMASSPLITAHQLRHRVAEPGVVVVDCRFQLEDPTAGERAYLGGHVAGACYAHLEADLSGSKTARSGRHPLPSVETMCERFGRLGIGNNATVVAYDDVGGGLAAARLWWMLRHLGHVEAYVLDGGWQAWLASGGAVRSGAETRRPATLVGQARPDTMLDTGQVARIAALGDWALIDSRALPRFRGDEEPIDPVAGHIPGARHRFWSDNLTAGGHMRPPAELRAAFNRFLAGVAPERAVFYCGSGVTSALQVLAMEAAGLPGSRLYPGSWSEWCSDPARPVARGE